MGPELVEHLRADTLALAAAARSGPPEAPIEACPGWDLAQLCSHVGTAHRWATAALNSSAQPDVSTLTRRGPDQHPAEYLEAGLDPLLEAIGARHDDEPVWNWAKAPQVAAFWGRRMAHETLVHRWDAQRAVGLASPIQADVAVDGIDEIFEVFVPSRLGGRDGIDVGGSIHLHCTDADGEWTLRTDDGIFRFERGHTKGDVAVRGPADQLLLLLWRRVPVDAAGVEVFGDPVVMDRWLALGAP